eukprot:7056664-Lingulodinium_polyedra.AAC.1
MTTVRRGPTRRRGATSTKSGARPDAVPPSAGLEAFDNAEMKCMKYRHRYMQYSFLWTDSVDETFERLLQEGPRDLVG